jgi:Co/Zn/Cd efflux system component
MRQAGLIISFYAKQNVLQAWFPVLGICITYAETKSDPYLHRMGATLHQGGHHHHSHGGSPGYSPTESGHQSQDDEISKDNSKHLLDDTEKLVEYGSISNANVHDVEKNDHGHSHKEKNINVRAAFIHVLGDLVQSLGVLIAAVIIWFKVTWIFSSSFYLSE